MSGMGSRVSGCAIKLRLVSTCSLLHWAVLTDFVILSNIDLSSRMNVGRVTLLRSAPGLNWEIMCERTVLDLSMLSSIPAGCGLTISLVWLDHCGVVAIRDV